MADDKNRSSNINTMRAPPRPVIAPNPHQLYMIEQFPSVRNYRLPLRIIDRNGNFFTNLTSPSVVLEARQAICDEYTSSMIKLLDLIGTGEVITNTLADNFPIQTSLDILFGNALIGLHIAIGDLLEKCPVSQTAKYWTLNGLAMVNGTCKLVGQFIGPFVTSVSALQPVIVRCEQVKLPFDMSMLATKNAECVKFCNDLKPPATKTSGSPEFVSSILHVTPTRVNVFDAQSMSNVFRLYMDSLIFARRTHFRNTTRCIEIIRAQYTLLNQVAISLYVLIAGLAQSLDCIKGDNNSVTNAAQLHDSITHIIAYSSVASYTLVRIVSAIEQVSSTANALNVAFEDQRQLCTAIYENLLFEIGTAAVLQFPERSGLTKSPMPEACAIAGMEQQIVQEEQTQRQSERTICEQLYFDNISHLNDNASLISQLSVISAISASTVLIDNVIQGLPKESSEKHRLDLMMLMDIIASDLVRNVGFAMVNGNENYYSVESSVRSKTALVSASCPRNSFAENGELFSRFTFSNLYSSSDEETPYPVTAWNLLRYAFSYCINYFNSVEIDSFADAELDVQLAICQEIRANVSPEYATGIAPQYCIPSNLMQDQLKLIHAPAIDNQSSTHDLFDTLRHVLHYPVRSNCAVSYLRTIWKIKPRANLEPLVQTYIPERLTRPLTLHYWNAYS